jgi:hypothetical protein
VDGCVRAKVLAKYGELQRAQVRGGRRRGGGGQLKA